MNNEIIEVIEAANKDDKEFIYKLRYQIYINEMKKGIDSADCQRKLLYDDMDEWATIYYLRKGQKIIGTIRLNRGTYKDFSEANNEIYSLEKFQSFMVDEPMLLLVSRFMVLPEYRGTKMAYYLIAKAFEYARDNNIKFSFCSCTPELLNLYEQLGFRRYTRNYSQYSLGYRIPLVLLNEDIQYFHSIGSVFYRLARKRNNSEAPTKWFNDNFLEANIIENRQAYNETDFWGFLNRNLKEDPLKKIGLFSGLSKKEVQKLSKSMAILRCEEGDIIIGNNDIGNETFILLAGEAELSGQTLQGENFVSTLNLGESFGRELHNNLLFESYNVIALSDITVLILPVQLKEKLIKLKSV